MTASETDQRWMQEALGEGLLGMDEGNMPVGAIIVHDGHVIARGHNRVDSQQRPTAHAELEAIRQIEPFLAGHRGECDLYTTLEPCPMCLGAILLCQFRRVIIALASPATGGLALIQGRPDYADRCPGLTMDVAADESRSLLHRYRERHPTLDPQRESMLQGLLGPR